MNPPETAKLKQLSEDDKIFLILQQQEIILQYEKRIVELERYLLAYDNAHTPPSRQQRHYPKVENFSGNRGSPKGHEGITRPEANPTETKTLTLTECPDCHNSFLKLNRVERRVIEELPEPRPLRVIEFFINHYQCSKCNKEIVASDSELPKEGRLGNNLQTHIVLAKHEDRLPCRKIVNTLSRQYNLHLTPATIQNVIRRVATQLEPLYKKIKKEVRTSSRVNADETGARVEGKKHWLWLFMSKLSVLFVFRKKREAKVIREILGKKYEGILTVDGLKAYATIVKKIQRCWAHLLRESKFLAQKHEGQSRVLYNSLCELFEQVKQKSISYQKAMDEMNRFLRIASTHQELRKFTITINNGLNYWFTCLLYSDVEPTNNRAEQQLREFVIQRKIYPTFRSKQGPKTTEILMSTIATWKIRGHSPLTMLRQTISS